MVDIQRCQPHAAATENSLGVAGSLDRRERGALVEAAARRHLLAAGLGDVACNASFRGGEIDLIMLDDGGGERCLVFVEVRYRSPADSVAA